MSYKGERERERDARSYSQNFTVMLNTPHSTRAPPVEKLTRRNEAATLTLNGSDWLHGRDGRLFRLYPPHKQIPQNICIVPVHTQRTLAASNSCLLHRSAPLNCLWYFSYAFFAIRECDYGVKSAAVLLLSHFNSGTTQPTAMTLTALYRKLFGVFKTFLWYTKTQENFWQLRVSVRWSLCSCPIHTQFYTQL